MLGFLRTGQDPTWTSALPAAWHSTTWVTDRTRAFIEQHDHEQPFCLWTSYPDPHHSFDCPEPWAGQYRADEVDISRTYHRDLDSRPWWHRAALESQPTAKSEKVRALREQWSRIQPQTGDQQSRDCAYNEWNLHPSRNGDELRLCTVRTKDSKLTIDLISGPGEPYFLSDDQSDAPV